MTTKRYTLEEIITLAKKRTANHHKLERFCYLVIDNGIYDPYDNSRITYDSVKYLVTVASFFLRAYNLTTDDINRAIEVITQQVKFRLNEGKKVKHLSTAYLANLLSDYDQPADTNDTFDWIKLLEA